MELGVHLLHLFLDESVTDHLSVDVCKLVGAIIIPLFKESNIFVQYIYSVVEWVKDFRNELSESGFNFKRCILIYYV